jgi:hypothetical protein
MIAQTSHFGEMGISLGRIVAISDFCQLRGVRKLQYTGQSVLSEGSSVSDLKSNGLTGILPFNRSNLCTRP